MNLRRPQTRWYLIAAAVLLLCLQTTLAADQGKLSPQPRHNGESQIIAELLSSYHYRDHAIDNTLSRQAFVAYFEALDPQHYYFLASDIARFSDYRVQLDNLLEQGQLQVAYEIFKLYSKRVEARSRYAVSLLDELPEFDRDTTLDLDRSDAEWADSVAELDALWRKRVTHDALTLKLSGSSPEEVRETLTGRYQRMTRNLHQYAAEDVFQLYMNAWASVYDPHTSYLSPRTAENFDINMSLSLQGIGALLRSEGDYIEIVELIPGGPAAKSGELKPGDRIIGVAQGREGKMVDVVGWRLPDVVDLIRGPKESVVRLRILPADAGANAHPGTITLVRNRIELKEQAAQSEIIEIPRGNRTYRIGVIEIPAFYIDFDAAQAGRPDYRSTTHDVRDLLGELKRKDIDGLVIDLRGNAGGSLSEAIRLTGLFIEDGPVVQVRRSDGELEVLNDDDGHTLVYTGPLALLVGSFSASASEIFAAAIQDYNRGVIIGNRTFGKGTVQTMIDLSRFGIAGDGATGRLKLTIAKFYRVTGASTQLRGVTPDIALPSDMPADEVGEAAAENPLPWDHISATSYTPVSVVDGILPELKRRHRMRTANDPAYQSLVNQYERLRERQSRTVVSLDEASRREARKEFEATQLAAINRRLQAVGREPVESLEAVDEEALPDTLLQEAAEITVDIGLLRTGTGAAPRIADADRPKKTEH